MDVSALASSQNSRSTTALSQLTGNLDQFLTLLTTQLRNQDPLDPLDTEKFTSQLVQFASVEQSIQTNRNLETLIGLQSAADRDGALSMIGKQVFVDGDKIANSGAGGAWSYTLPAGASSVSLLVLDDKGVPVGQFTGDPAEGAHDFVWDGLTASGAAAPDGVYQLVVSAKDASGGVLSHAIEAKTFVSGVRLDADGPQLETTTGAVALSAIRRVIGA